jgi:hypothetical protein
MKHVRSLVSAALPLVLAAGTALSLVLAPGEAGANSILPAIESARTEGGQVMKHYVEVDDGVWVAVKGMRERRQVRFARLVRMWSKDQQKVALKQGWPSFRWREDYAGRVSEVWSYPEADREFVFDVETGRLMDKRVR